MSAAVTRHTGRREGRAQALLASLLGCTAGVSAVEFALLAPVLVIGAFSTADAGRAIYERMMIDQSLRAAAQMAMAGADVDDVRAVLEEVASQNFTVAQDPPGDTAPAGNLSIGVVNYCSCPGETLAELGCTAICNSGLGTTQFYRLTASKTFDGVMLPAFDLAGSVAVMAE